ncbi:MAG: transcriptional regulator [Candidatus Asgardarchaeia archaeon]
MPAIDEVTEVLRKAKYTVYKNSYGITFCFDVLAKKNNELIVIKIVHNIDCFDEGLANSLKMISLAFEALPIVIGEKTRHSNLETGVIYFRYDLPVVNLETFSRMVLYSEFPLIYIRRGGYYVKLNSTLLKNLRESKGISLGELADKIGVSRRTIYEYERGAMDATLETAIKLEEFFNTPIALPIPLLKLKVVKIKKESLASQEVPQNPLLRLLYKKLSQLGFKVILFKHTPFDALTLSKKHEVISGVDDKGIKANIETKIHLIENFSKITGKEALFVVSEMKRINTDAEYVKIVTSSELKHIRTMKHFLELVES